MSSISSFQTAQTDILFDLSPLWVPLLDLFFGRTYGAVGYQNDVNMDKFTQEVRLASQGTRPLDWVMGGFYTNEDSTNDEGFLLRDAPGQPAPNDIFAVLTRSNYEEFAGFGDITWYLTDRFDVTGGVRYARNVQEVTQDSTGLFGVSLLTNRSSESVFTYLANARYHSSDHSIAYLRYATGYRPGGPNTVANDPITGEPLAPPTFDADELKSYEAGFKAETADGRFGVELAGFYIDWNNVQVTAVRNGFGVRVNAPGGATVRGVELALNARPSRAFTMMTALAYQDAEVSEADADISAAKGERLPNVPRFTGTLGADYVFTEDGLQPTIGTTLRYISDRRASFLNSASPPQYYIPDYTTIDLRAGCRIGLVSAQLYIRNLLDERGQLATFNWNSVNAQPAIIQPRTIGVTFSTQF